MKSLLPALCLALVSALVSAVFAAPAVADRRTDLIAQIEASAKNDFRESRHSVTVDGCTIITQSWHETKEQGWVLWSSFVYAMVDANLQSSKKAPEGYFVDQVSF